MELDITVLNPHRDTGFIDLIINNRWVQAKVYDEPSIYGVNDCRVSKLAIAKKGIRLLGLKSGLPFFDNLAFNYDRGHDVFDQDDITQEEVDAIVDYLNTLPKQFEEE